MADGLYQPGSAEWRGTQDVACGVLVTTFFPLV